MRASNINITKNRTVRIKNSLFTVNPQPKTTKRDGLYNEFVSEGCEDFYNYIDWLDLAKSPNIVVLPKSNHYFYQAEDLEKTEAVVKLGCLNQTKNLDLFLSNIFENINDGCYFTGCFKDNNGNHLPASEAEGVLSDNSEESLLGNTGIFSGSGFLSRLIQRMDSTVIPELTRTSVKNLLKEVGFTVLDMTELNGKIYFCAQKR
jgi:hypothetical protein